jgi:hypothetical protein
VEAGFKCYVDTSKICEHIKPVNICNMSPDVQKLYANNKEALDKEKKERKELGEKLKEEMIKEREKEKEKVN